jgi:hypothetical protein
MHPRGRMSSHRWSLVKQSARDLTLIFIGVLAALAADSYAEDVRNARLETEYLQRLSRDIQDNEHELELLITLWRRYEGSGREVMRYLASRDAERDDPDAVVVAAVLASLITVPTLENPTYDELVGSSRLNLIRDPGVREALLRYARRLQFGDAFIARLDRQYEAEINLRVPADLVRTIARACRPAPFGVPAQCPPDLAGFDVSGFLAELRGLSGIRGKLNWRIADATRVREILEIRLEEAATAKAAVDARVR